MQLEKQSHLEISLLCVICDRDKSEKVISILEKKKNFLSLITLGKGTANSKTLGYLGLGETEKAIFFSMIPTDMAESINEELDENLKLEKPGHGISFAAKTYQGCYHHPVKFANTEVKDIMMQNELEHNLIIVVLNRGYSEDVMESARAAGAGGGTLLNARSCGMAGMEKFFGVVIAPEKEMIMIVAKDSDTINIMSAIAEKTGPKTDASAVSFSMPVNNVKGLNTVKVDLK